MSKPEETEPGSETAEILLLDRGLGWFTSGLNSLGTLGIIGLMVLINADIAGRVIFGLPISGVPEMVSLSIVGIVFFQLAHTLRVGRLTRSDSFLQVISQKFPIFHHMLEMVFNLVGASLMAVLFYSSLPFFIKSWENDIFVGAIGDFTAPVWPVKLIILIGVAATFFQFLLSSWSALSNGLKLKSSKVI